MTTIYHKPNCSTSLKTLALLKQKTDQIRIIQYIDSPPNSKELKELLKMLGLRAEELVRKKESLYKEQYASKKMTEAEWIKVLIKNPILIERPIVVKGKKAVLGRPPERVMELF